MKAHTSSATSCSAVCYVTRSAERVFLRIYLTPLRTIAMFRDGTDLKLHDPRMLRSRIGVLAAMALMLTPLLLCPAAVRAQATPLDSIARLAIARNLGVRQARETERQSGFAVRQARGLFLPTVGVEARYSELSGAIDIGDAINPAYAALNQLIGRDEFPTDIHQTLPFKQETKLRSTLPLFNGAIIANLSAARAIRDLRGAERAAATRRLDADARLAYLNYARAARAVEVWEAALPVLVENERVADRLLSAGTLTGDAVHRARAAKADGDQQHAEAKRLRNAALGALNLLLDREADVPVPMLSDSLSIMNLLSVIALTTKGISLSGCGNAGNSTSPCISRFSSTSRLAVADQLAEGSTAIVNQSQPTNVPTDRCWRVRL